NHTVLTPWGFVALVAFEGRPEGLQILKDPEWEAAKAEVLKALRILDPQGNPTPLLQAVAELRVVRLSPDEFISARKALLDVCSGCHSRDFALKYIASADRVIRESTLQLADAIKAIAEARKAGILPPRPGEEENPYPFLLNFYEEPSGIDREAWLIFLEYRMRAFQGMFHVNPDYTHWYGWSEIRRALKDINETIELYRRLKSVEEDSSAALDKALTALSSAEETGQALSKVTTMLRSLEKNQSELASQLDTAVAKAESATSNARTALAISVVAIAVSIIGAGLVLARRAS
ncbi:MAG: hypothetical protein ABWW69_00960, partial [Pyrodictiaceae archaeon]